MGVIDEMKDIADLVKKAGDIDLYRRIVNLEGEIIDLTRAKRTLEEAIVELRRALDYKRVLVLRDGFYWAEDDNQPFCPGCWDAKQKAVHIAFTHVKEMGSRFQCPNCKTMYRPRM
jgi:hypothetical protein